MTSPSANFQSLLEHCNQVVAGQPPRQALQAVCSLLKSSVPHYDWVGFYLADSAQKTLDLGPYDGEPTEHTRIAFGRGICGQAAVSKNTFVVPDVSKEANYLSCSVNVKSEIVLPILDGKTMLGELDIDSHTPNAFTDADREFLEKICSLALPLVRKIQKEN